MLFSVAHPDDDVMGAAGLIALHREDRDLRFVLLHATDGEAGENHLVQAWPPRPTGVAVLCDPFEGL